MKKPVTKKMSRPTQGHQGDVLFTPIDKIPTGLKRSKEAILAYGEVTGHKHEILDEVDYYLSDGSDPWVVGFLDVKKEVDIVHEDHEGITIYPGKYEIRNQCEIEVNEEDKEIFRRVLD